MKTTLFPIETLSVHLIEPVDSPSSPLACGQKLAHQPAVTSAHRGGSRSIWVCARWSRKVGGTRRGVEQFGSSLGS